MTPAPSAARTEALTILDGIDPIAYASTRNHLDGAVTRLSRYLRHGVVSLAEARDAGLARVASPEHCVKFLQELGWRDYFQRVWRHLGRAIWCDLQPYKTGLRANDYADELPADVSNAETGVDYVDAFARELHETGYLHNHARLWLAAYVVHARRVRWQAGARWFLSHLVDGDEASNNLSWQWVASTFGPKPYVFNRDSLLKFTRGRFPPHDAADPFDEDDYAVITRRLFRPVDVYEPQKRYDFTADPDADHDTDADANDREKTAVWVHDGMMSEAHPAVGLASSAFFVWDDAHVRSAKHSPLREAFQRSALFCDDEHTGPRSLADTVVDAARRRGATAVVTGDTADPRLREAMTQVAAAVPLRVVADRPFVRLKGRPNLQRFSRYWTKAERVLVR